MRLEITEQLSEETRNAIEELIQTCREYEGLTLTFPFEDVTVTYLLWRNQPGKAPGLLAALGLLLPAASCPDADSSCGCEEPIELCAFTRPSERRKGLFSRLFEEAGEYFDDRDLLFLLDHHSTDALAVAEHLGAEPESEDYRMEYEFQNFEDFIPLTKPRLFLSETREDSSTTRYECFLPGEEKASALCRTRAFGSRVCFYDFSVREELRGRGLGREAFLLVLETLRRNGCTGIFLHVNGSNLPAVSLYQKTGFRICETLSYYLY